MTESQPSPSTSMDLTRRGFLAATAVGATAVSMAVTARPAHADESSVLTVSSLNPDPANATAALQAAFDSDADTVVVDWISGGYSTGPLFIERDDLHVIIEPDVTIRALGTEFFPDVKDALITIKDQTGITITGYGARLIMRPYSSGEWRHALNLLGVQDFTLQGLTVQGGGGDGIYLGNSNSGAANRNANVQLLDIRSEDARRNSFSVITVDGLTVEGCAFVNTKGTLPQAGVDIEPNHASETLTDIEFSECWFEGNRSNGWNNHTTKLTATSTPYSILVRNTTFGHQVGGTPTVIDQGRLGRGVLEFRDCLVNVGTNSGGIGLFDKSSDGGRVVLTRATVWAVGNAMSAYGPIGVFSGNLAAKVYDSYGAVDLADCVVVSDLPVPAFKAHDVGALDGLTDVHGTITVSTPNASMPQTDFGATPTDVDLTATVETWGTTAEVSVTASATTVTGGNTANLTFHRTGSDLSTPLAIAYATSGTAKERYDYGGLGKVAVIKPGDSSVTLPVRTLARHRTSDPSHRSLVVSIVSGHRYVTTATGSSVEVVIVG